MSTAFGPKPKNQGTINSDANRLWGVQRVDNLQRLYEEARDDEAEALYQAEASIRTLCRTIGVTGDDAYAEYLGLLANMISSMAKKLDNKNK